MNKKNEIKSKTMTENEILKMTEKLEKLGINNIRNMERTIIDNKTLWIDLKIDTILILNDDSLNKIQHISIGRTSTMIQLKDLNLDIELVKKE